MFGFGAPPPIELGITTAFLLLVLFPIWRICAKAGFPGWYSLAVLIPILNLLFLYYLAFASWPAVVESEVRQADAVDR